MVRLSRNSRPQTQIGIRMGICMLWRQRFIPCHEGYPILEVYVKLARSTTTVEQVCTLDIVAVKILSATLFSM